MTINEAVARLRGLLEGGVGEPRLLPRYPSVAIDLTPRRITAVRVTHDRKSGANILRHLASRDLPEGAIVPSLTALNVRSPEEVKEALGEVLGKVGAGEHRISVLLPDHVARVALLGFANLPRTRKELVDLVRFRMAKSLPFKTDEAALDLQIVSGAGAVPGQPSAATVLSTFMKRSVLQQYESLFTEAGYWPGLVALSTFELFNLFRGRIGEEPAGEKDVMLLNVTPFYASIVIFNDGRLIFYRCKPHPDEGSQQDQVAALKREVYTSLAFYQEKLLGRGVGRAFLRVVGLPRDEVHAVVTAETMCDGERLELSEAISFGEGVAIDEQAAAWAAPASGATVGRRA